MLNKAKLLEFFDASKVRERINVIGCGAIGSHVCEQLARLGFSNVHLYDFDKVEAHNITNQMFTQEQLGMYKVDACKQMMVAINSDLKTTVSTHIEGLVSPYTLDGYILLCVDNIELRRDIVKSNRYNPMVKAIMDFRMRLTDAQYYCARRTKQQEMDSLLMSMDFTHEEATAATPKSACGYELSVIYTVKIIVSVGIANLVKLCQGAEDVKKLILIDTNMFTLDAF